MAMPWRQRQHAGGAAAAEGGGAMLRCMRRRAALPRYLKPTTVGRASDNLVPCGGQASTRAALRPRPVCIALAQVGDIQ